MTRRRAGPARHSRLISIGWTWSGLTRRIEVGKWHAAVLGQRVNDSAHRMVCARISRMDTGTNDIPPQASRLAPKLRALADQGVYFGTSSWKYDGWVGSIYSGDRYVTRGKFSKAKFEENCLTEYAQTFPTVCGDLTFYQFPSEQYWAKLFDATPKEFIFGFKVPEDITVETWPKHARYGKRAGLANEHFLNAEALEQFFTSRLKRYGKQVGPLIFEFGTFNKKTFPTPADFLAVLDPFLKALPEGFRYAVDQTTQVAWTADGRSVVSGDLTGRCGSGLLPILDRSLYRCRWRRGPPLSRWSPRC